MAAGLLAALFAMGVFSANGVGAHGGDTDTEIHDQLDNIIVVADATPEDPADGTLSTDTGEMGTLIALTNMDKADDTSITGFDEDSHEYSIKVLPQQRVLYVTVDGDSDGGFIVARNEVTVEADGESVDPIDDDSDPGLDQDVAGQTVYAIDLRDGIVKEIEITADDTDTADSEEGVYTIAVNHSSPTNSDSAGATVRLTIMAMLRAEIDDEISIDLTGFTLPSSIDVDDITINRVNPSDVSISGNKIILVLPDLAEDDDTDQSAAEAEALADPHDLGGIDGKELATIRISNKAGIANPTKASTYSVKVSDEDYVGGTADVDAISFATVIRTISIDPDKGGSGSEITVTGKGFTDGQATIFIDKAVAEVPAVEDDPETDDDEAKKSVPAKPDGNGRYDAKDTVLGRADIDDGSFTFTTDKVTTDATINAFDTDDAIAAAGKKFAVTSSISVSPSEISSAETLTINLKDWDDDDRVTKVTFTGGEEVIIPIETEEEGEDADENFVSYDDPSDGEDGILKVTVPSDVSSGKASVKVYVGSTASGTAEITISALNLRVSPETVVPGQQLTIQGSGFNRNDCVDSVTVGGISAHSDNEQCDEDVKASSAGNIVVSVVVQSPEDKDAIGSGEKTVVVTTASGRKGEATVTIPEATLTLDPAESRRGSTVAVEAAGFPAGDLIQIKYGGIDGRTVAAATTDASGAVSLSFDVPSTATIGEETTVAAVSVGNYAKVTAEAKHSTPGATVSVTPSQVVSGGSMTISGTNLPAQVAVAQIEINGIDVRPVPAPSTGADGSFEATVLVPQLELGNQRVSIRVAESTPTTFVEVVTAAPSGAPADVFASLGDNLQVVWQYDNATSMWASYDPAAPAELNDLSEVGAGSIVWVEVTEDQEFQGQQLYAGWNLITLN